jgi:galactokinase
MRGEATAGKPEIIQRLIARLPAGARALAWFVPGRLEVLGKHTDYAGGRSLLCAVERGFSIAAAPRDDHVVTVTDAATGGAVTAAMDDQTVPAGVAGARTTADWAAYPEAVVRRVSRNFPRARRGADILFESDLPPAAGLASSSALVVAVLLALVEVNDLGSDETFARTIQDDEALAAYAATIENGRAFGPLEGDAGVGTAGGSEDHTAILCCRAETLSQYAFGPVRLEREIALDPAYVFAVGASGVAARKTGGAMEGYNRAAGAAARLLELWREATGRADESLAAAVASAPEAADRLRAIVRERGGGAAAAPLIDRLDQFVEESGVLVPAAVDRLAAGDLPGFGALVDRSHAIAATRLRNQVPETIALAAAARVEGAAAASAFGAGFGGSVWALVRRAEAAPFLERWASSYARVCPDTARRATFFLTRPGPAAARVAGGRRSS